MIHFYKEVPHKHKMCDNLRNLVPFVQVKNRGKRPQRSVTFRKVADISLQLY